METSVSLLQRLRAQNDEVAWRRLDALYRPLITRWLALDQALGADAEDLVQEVMGVLIREIPTFQRERMGSFRRWLRHVTLRRLKNFWRQKRTLPEPLSGREGDSILLQLEDPNSDLSTRWDTEHDQYVLNRMLELIEQDFQPVTWLAFHGVSVNGRSPDEVATELGISTNAVLLAKSRVLKRLREESAGFLG